MICVEYAGESIEFTPVEIMAMYISNLKKIIETKKATSVSFSVIGVPSYLTDSKRTAYLDAMEIAGFNRSNVHLMHEGSAIALEYVYNRRMMTGVVVFVDVGDCDTQVTVVRFYNMKLQVLRHESDRNLGGRDFDMVLFDYFADLFPNLHKGDYSMEMRSRLMMECEKAKIALSSNIEASISIESFMDESDFAGVITREKFQLLSSPLLCRITSTCEKALTGLDLDMTDVHSIELVGLGSQIPAISDHLSIFFKKNPLRTLKAKECVAHGCSMRSYHIKKNANNQIPGQ